MPTESNYHKNLWKSYRDITIYQKDCLLISEKRGKRRLVHSSQHMLREKQFPDCPISVLKHCNVRNYIQRSGCRRRGWARRRQLFHVTFAVAIFRTLNRYVKRFYTNSMKLTKKLVAQVTSFQQLSLKNQTCKTKCELLRSNAPVRPVVCFSRKKLCVRRRFYSGKTWRKNAIAHAFLLVLY